MSTFREFSKVMLYSCVMQAILSETPYNPMCLGFFSLSVISRNPTSVMLAAFPIHPQLNLQTIYTIILYPKTLKSLIFHSINH